MPTYKIIMLLTTKVPYTCKTPFKPNQMNIKALISSVVIGTASIFTGVGEAQASTCFTTNIGSVICNTYQGTNGYGEQVFTLGYAHDHVSEQMVVTCDGKRFVRYESQGSLTKLGAGRVARYFCSI